MLALPLTASLAGVAAADPGNGNANGLDNGNANGVSDSSATAPSDPGFIGPVAPAAPAAAALAGPVAPAGPAAPVAEPFVGPTPFVNQGGVTTGANTTSYETVADGKGSTFTGVGGGQPSGDISGPQPYSSADQNNTGANDTSASNPYRSTREGSPSLNGNGGGEQVGQPCAGCVGRADNKNPPGQAPDATDVNAGYECDRNHGIGRSNPAHTGCVAALVHPSPTESPTPTGTPRSTETPTPTGTPTSTETPTPTGTPTSTETPTPTGTPTSTETPTPTGTPKSTETPKPTGTPKSTETPKPTVSPTFCPNTTTPMPPGGVKGCTQTVLCPNGSPVPPGGMTACTPGTPGVACPPGSTMVNGLCVVPPQGGFTPTVPTVPTVCPAGTNPMPTGACVTPVSGGTTNPGTTTTEQPGTSTTPGTTPGTQPLTGTSELPGALPFTDTTETPGGLPFTGSHTRGLLQLGGLLLLFGAVLSGVSRLRRTT